MNYHMRDMKRSKPARPGEIVEALAALVCCLIATALILALGILI